MKFISAGKVIGDAHQVRSVRVAQSPPLPDGEYSFIDMYCTDASCDCRKTMIQVTHDERTVAIINFGWESDTYYKKWMGIEEEDEYLFPPMSGADVDLNSPNLVDSKGVLTLFNSLLNDIWIARFKRHYQLVKAAVSKSQPKRKAVSTHIREAPKVGRNDPCSCNSGKKFKKCCGRKKGELSASPNDLHIIEPLCSAPVSLINRKPQMTFESQITDQAGQDQLNRVAVEFNRWVDKKTNSREGIPETLLREAQKLTQHYKATEVRRRLGLSKAQLDKLDKLEV